MSRAKGTRPGAQGCGRTIGRPGGGRGLSGGYANYAKPRLIWYGERNDLGARYGAGRKFVVTLLFGENFLRRAPRRADRRGRPSIAIGRRGRVAQLRMARPPFIRPFTDSTRPSPSPIDTVRTATRRGTGAPAEKFSSPRYASPKHGLGALRRACENLFCSGPVGVIEVERTELQVTIQSWEKFIYL